MDYNVRIWRTDGKPVNLVALIARLAVGLGGQVNAGYVKDDTGNVDPLKAELTIPSYDPSKILKIIKKTNRNYMFELMATNDPKG